MPILNYRTRISPEQTISEITTILSRKGARSITSEYDESNNVSGLRFVMKVGTAHIPFQLPVNYGGVAEILAGKKAVTVQIRERARWVTWRILKDWIGAQIALIEAGQAELQQVFMPYALAPDNRTAYQHFVDNTKSLGDGSQK